MDLKNSLVTYGVTLGMRYTRKQKQVFLNCVMQELQKQDISFQLQEKRSAVLSVTHLVIGNPASAERIIAASYDTPARALWPGYRWYPFRLAEDRRGDVKNLVLETLTVIALLAAAVFLFSLVPGGSLGQKILCIAAGIALALSGYLFSRGTPNKVNFSMNSAAVALVMDLIHECGTKDTAYVLMDESSTSLEGVKILREMITDTSEVLFLSALAEGDIKMIVHGRKSSCASSLKKELADFEDHELTEGQLSQSVLGAYPHGAILIRGERTGNDFTICNAKTGRDSNVDTAGLMKIERRLCGWIKEK